jgi:murein DD-endopeptidase MepM/ murein hydrolase activator NlpD
MGKTMTAMPLGALRSRARPAALAAGVALLCALPAQGQERSRFSFSDLEPAAAAVETDHGLPSASDAMYLSLAFAIDDFRNGAIELPGTPEADIKTGEPMTPEEEIAALRAEVAALRSALAEAERAKEALAYRLSLWTMTDISAAEDVIARTGLDADLMLLRLAEVQAALSAGGPYVPADDLAAGVVQDASLQALDTHVGRWDGLRQLLAQLPLAEPMDEFRSTSRFGERVDPINGRRAFHSGLDFAGPMRSTVRVTAPGVVVWADYKGGYGRLVEVDHGLGITTRYAHLSAILVEVGDEVGYRTPIGLLGSTGRSTGPHLHYEIRLDGEAIDPAPFVEAGRYVFKGPEEPE